ncbi:hypothetical protein NDU88_001227 [Pleurodeles waltl]|uniref:Uncharacterized protein n=1 Tax=Pleurodeles waltl TaxID=8319 RepID=A0AAV7NEJ4_PLEWA|nr:hypothetical protein NDU88_001227 [Pleurodeles waltl]
MVHSVSLALLAIARNREPTPNALKTLSFRLREAALGAHLSSPRSGPRQQHPARADLRLRIIEGCQSVSLRRRLLKKRYLDEIKEMMRVNDQAEEHTKKMEARKFEK